MGYYYCIAECVRCKITFGCNPDKVPSIRFPPPDGPKEPVCRNCIDFYNGIRRGLNLEPWVPLPGAYDPVDEFESLNEKDEDEYYSPQWDEIDDYRNRND